jgi:hypothetical protein
MPLFRMTEQSLEAIEPTSFKKEQIYERGDLQRILRDHFEAIDEETLIIAEEFGEWEDSARRIDLLGVDRSGTIVVIELKRTESGGHMELQALRYAAMVSNFEASDLVRAHQRYLEQRGRTQVDAPDVLCDFFEVDSVEEIEISDRPRVVLVSGGFGTELTTAVLWLNEGGLDLRCVEARPYRVDESLLLDVRQVIPLPEAADYQVQKREKTTRKKAIRQSNRDLTKYDFEAKGQTKERLPKRQLILAIVKHLIEQGISPEDVEKAIPGKRLFRVLEGEHDQESFESVSNAERITAGRSPDAFRFSTEDENLVHADGHTYALTLMWGLKTETAATQLQKAFPQVSFGFRRSAESSPA